MKFALIYDGLVHREATSEEAALPPGPDGKPLFDIRDVSKVDGIAPGWLANANGTYTPPPEPPAVVPQSVTSAQAKIQLLRTPGSSGRTMLDDVNAKIQADGGELAIWFSDARSWDRNNTNVTELGRSLKLSDSDIDALFVAASKISA